MLGLVVVLLALSSSIVSGYKGVQCGDFKCSDDSNVVCNGATGTCECKAGFTGNGRVMCIEDEMSICHMMGDPHIVAFNKERTSVLMPCRNILTKTDIISRANPAANRLFIRITATVAPAFNARFPAQVFITGLYVELYIRTDPQPQLTMICNDNGCYDTTSGQQYINYNSPSGNLNFTVTRNVNNQQILRIPFYEVEVRFRGEDGSVAITFPPSTFFDPDPGLCNTNTDAIDKNQQLGAGLGYSSYDNYILFVNQANIPEVPFESDPTCNKIKVGCQPEALEALAVNACSVFYTDRPFSECFYAYRNGNDSQILVDYNSCREDECAGITTPSICTVIGNSNCQLSQAFATGPCP